MFATKTVDSFLRLDLVMRSIDFPFPIPSLEKKGCGSAKKNHSPLVNKLCFSHLSQPKIEPGIQPGAPQVHVAMPYPCQGHLQVGRGLEEKPAAYLLLEPG